MALDVALLRESFQLVAERSPQITGRFYAIFFERFPQVRPMFGKDTSRQEKMLTDALVAVLDHLEDAPWLEQTLGTLGVKHLEYGVTFQMYDQVGIALLATLAEVAGDDWTPAVHDQWTLAYGAITGMMQAGAAAVIQTRPTQPSMAAISEP